MRLNLRPCSMRFATQWCAETHRRLPKIQGGLWAVSVRRGEMVVGVAIVGHPAAALMKAGALGVLRVAVLEMQPNACSMLYGACARAARAMGATDLVTYTHYDEPGTSLKAAGWIHAGMTAGGEWSRDGRARQASLFPEPKNRWLAPWGARAKGGW